MKTYLSRRFGPYFDILRAIWDNKDSLGYALRILRDGACDGCSLGTYGIRDWTMKGIHLCWIRLNLLRVNTMPPLDHNLLRDVSNLVELSDRRLRRLGRIPYPMMRRKGENGFRRITWEEAINTIVNYVRNSNPNRIAFYLTSRGIVNETYYVAQKVARFLGTNNIDYSARLCHSPSTKALKHAIGYAATTCSYKDLIGTDLIVIIGSNLANNQPVMMKYIHMARKKGTRVVVINPFKEPGLEKYWVPSSVDSAILGTNVADKFYNIRVGGDIAFINGVLKYLIANNWVNWNFIKNYTTGWDELVKELESESFEELERYSGISRNDMLDFAKIYASASTAVIIWSMGVTMHSYGYYNVRAIVNLALARGMIGRPKTGLMPIRGQSGVQGGAEVGVSPESLPGGLPLTDENVERFERLWGFRIPKWKGLTAPQVIESAYNGGIDILYCIGGNLLGVLPDTEYVEEALKRIPLRVHHDIVLNRQMLLEPRETVIILPATTRYEMEGGCTITSTERRIIFSPCIKSNRIEEARDEWRVLVDVASKVKPELADKILFNSTHDIREEIAKAVPFYDGIQRLSKKGDYVQWGGERLCEGYRFNTEDGKARFMPVKPLGVEVPPGYFILTTRRGKQFNSMTLSSRDAITGGGRNEVIMNLDDMEEIGVREGEEVILESRVGRMRARVRRGNIHSKSVIAFWPECNVLISRRFDESCSIPAYRDELVRIVPVRKSLETQVSI